MVELQKKYQIGVRRFGLINWTGFKSLYIKEVSRFLIVWAQTLLSPLVSSLLFFSVLSIAIGNERGEVLGDSFITFLAPGLIAMSVIQQAFSHSVSSIMIAKIQGNIIDTLMAPLSATEVSIAIILAAVTRSIIILIISTIVFSFIIDINIYNFFYILIGTFLGSCILGALGFKILPKETIKTERYIESLSINSGDVIKILIQKNSIHKLNLKKNCSIKLII